MFADVSYWKDELRNLAKDIRLYSSLEEDGEEDAPDVPYSEYRLERAIVLSAFIARALFESGKLTDRMNDFCLRVQRLGPTSRNNNQTMPLLRKFVSGDYYDFSSAKEETIQGKRFTNQIIHCFVVIAFEVNELDVATAFYVVSDYDAQKALYRCSFEDWQDFITAIADDEIYEIRTSFDPKQEKWITSRK